jgi:hypothetical protein
VNAEGVLAHDPTWGPDRQFTTADLLRRWAATGYWTLRIERPVSLAPADGDRVVDAATPPADRNDEARADDRCGQLLDRALDDIEAGGRSRADAALLPVIAQCPGDARPLGELAAVRFAEQAYGEADRLARQALLHDPQNAFAADVLGSSRFLQDDVVGALDAWNLAGKPRLDSVQISGLTRTRYALVADALGLEPEVLLRADAFTRARHTLASMPDVAASRISLQPGDDGFAVVDVAVLERPMLPRTWLEWGAAAGRAAIDRTVDLRVPGRGGQGEVWSASWRWWARRPAASLAFAAPLAANPAWTWSASLSWDAQTYGPDTVSAREERLRGGLTLSSWLRPDTQVSWSAALESWTRADGSDPKTVSLTAAIVQRAFDDRVGVRVSVEGGTASAGTRAFGAAGAAVTFSSRDEPGPLLMLARAGVSGASVDAPLALWSGAGDGQARDGLSRAHPLIHDGRIDGPVFGRGTVTAGVEVQHWLARPALPRLGAALFVDAAGAANRPAYAVGKPFQVDAGVGLRVRAPGTAGFFRIDYAHGLRDGADAVTFGWQVH